jgi:hypothetical protein
LPCSSGSSICSTEAKKASRSTWKMTPMVKNSGL